MMDWIGIMKEVVASSTQLSTWALAIAGGGVLAIVSSSYRRPTQLRWRAPYLLFLPGWFFLGLSMYHGKRIESVYLAALHGSAEKHRVAALAMNEFYAAQQDALMVALVVFGLWLLAYVLMWTFFDISAT